MRAEGAWEAPAEQVAIQETLETEAAMAVELVTAVAMGFLPCSNAGSMGSPC